MSTQWERMGNLINSDVPEITGMFQPTYINDCIDYEWLETATCYQPGETQIGYPYHWTP